MDDIPIESKQQEMSHSNTMPITKLIAVVNAKKRQRFIE